MEGLVYAEFSQVLVKGLIDPREDCTFAGIG